MSLLFYKMRTFIAQILILSFFFVPSFAQNDQLIINDLEYLEMTGLDVMLAHDFYPESHQGGVGVIQNGLRVATNGDLRLEPTPGQWQPVPKVGQRMVDRAKGEISVRMEYPDQDKNRKGFNPILYPDLNFSYVVKIKPEGKSFRIIVDLDKPLPEAWIGKVGFNFELFPGILFGKSFYMDQHYGIFTRQANGPMYTDKDGELQIVPMASGKKLVVAPESDSQRMIIENMTGTGLELIDGRGKHNNGWFVVRSLVAKGATKNAVEWLITPDAVPGWKYEPVVQISQVGYHPKQQKVAIIETDIHDEMKRSASLLRISEQGGFEKVLETAPKDWGKFLRYHYYQLDFSSIEKPGMYVVRYGNYQTEPFQIGEEVFRRHVWQPTLEYFLPAQMCHMRVNERYRVWHGACHLDDARMAPTDTNHFDGYLQGPSTLTKYKSGEHVPGLDRGGWHDAGDFDLRVESQAETIHGLALAYEAFGIKYDNTTIDQKNRLVEIQVPDGKADILQQIEHG
ncbi:MAG: cellulase N-terminal Ig-like domain-containing protein, partial [Cytophagaceae bacterium]